MFHASNTGNVHVVFHLETIINEYEGIGQFIFDKKETER